MRRLALVKDVHLLPFDANEDDREHNDQGNKQKNHHDDLIDVFANRPVAAIWVFIADHVRHSIRLLEHLLRPKIKNGNRSGGRTKSDSTSYAGGTKSVLVQSTKGEFR